MAKIERTRQDIEAHLKALKAAGLPDLVAEYEQLLAEKIEQEKLEKPAEASKVEARPAVSASLPSSKGAVAHFDFVVDVASFESGGQRLDAPTIADTYKGHFVDVIRPKSGEKMSQVWFIFETVDERVLQQKGKQVRSALIFAPLKTSEKESGAFRIKDTLVDLNLPYLLEGNRLTGDIPIGLSCQLTYEEYVDKGERTIRLQSVKLDVQQAI